MPLIPDRPKSLVEHCLSDRIVPDSDLLDLQFREARRPEWSNLTSERIRYFNNSREEKARQKTHFKEYPSRPFFPLDPGARGVTEMPLIEALHRRATSREFSGGEVSFSELSCLVESSNGTKEGSKARINPSGGQRFPLEMYVLVNRVSGLEPGIYHYHVKRSGLEQLNANSPQELLKSMFSMDDRQVGTCGFAIILTAVSARSIIKYGSLGYRLIFMEAGHLSQSLLLLATGAGVKAWPIAAINERPFYRELKINPHQEFFVFSILFGK